MTPKGFGFRGSPLGSCWMQEKSHNGDRKVHEFEHLAKPYRGIGPAWAVYVLLSLLPYIVSVLVRHVPKKTLNPEPKPFEDVIIGHAPSKVQVGSRV